MTKEIWVSVDGMTDVEGIVNIGALKVRNY